MHGPAVAQNAGMRRFLPLLLLLLAPTAEARPQRAGTHPGPFLGIDFGVHDPTGKVYASELEQGPALRAIAGWRLTRFASVEVAGFHSLSRNSGAPEQENPQHSEVSADLRLFPFDLDGRRFEPNLLVGYSPHAEVRYPGRSRLSGSSASVGAGLRFNSDGRFFFQMDARWRFVRYANFAVVDEESGGVTKGKCPRYLHGDGVSVTIGSGWQF